MAETDVAAGAVGNAAVQTPNFLSNPQAFMDAVGGSLNKTLVDGVAALPGMVAGLVLVIIGWVVGSIVAGIFRRILEFAKFEEFLQSHRLEDALGNVQVSNVLVQLAKYYIILVFVQAAFSMLTLGSLTDFLARVIDFAPKVIGAILIAVVAAMIGELVKEKILEVHEKETYMRMLGNGTKYLMVFFGVVIGLETLGFPTTILTGTFLILVQAVGIAFGLAVGLAFGFGGQEAAKEWIKEGRKRFHV